MVVLGTYPGRWPHLPFWVFANAEAAYFATGRRQSRRRKMLRVTGDGSGFVARGEVGLVV